MCSLVGAWLYKYFFRGARYQKKFVPSQKLVSEKVKILEIKSFLFFSIISVECVRANNIYFRGAQHRKGHPPTTTHKNMAK